MLPIDPCMPSPCGPNSQCRVISNQPACSCLPNYSGRPPNCRPECTISAECPGNLACQQERCTNPCPGSCGPGATCRPVNHKPVCACSAGFTGDPFAGCVPQRKQSSWFLFRNIQMDLFIFYVFINLQMKILFLLFSG
ncbi:keratin-associated protein 10-2-like [Homalodisca vitripennis]|uniref:keratin-associated protein 10-2-like n=1 Tax=Homalodisca vitripennis TaxID=197043 RepID=UPI001EEA3538|nr:keratin-associated protein 10-2-like [Homalodisca vitripennis]